MEHKHVHQVYESIAEEFDNSRFCYWNSVKTFLDNCDDNSLIADIGCGNGKYMKYKTDKLHYIGIDMCEKLLLLNSDKDVVRSNALYLPYRDNVFDAVISIAVLHHIYNPKDRIKFVGELIRICKVHGSIHITVWADKLKKNNMKALGNGDYFISWRHKLDRYYHLFTKEELLNILRHFDNISYQIGYEMENWHITINKLDMIHYNLYANL